MGLGDNLRLIAQSLIGSVRSDRHDE